MTSLRRHADVAAKCHDIFKKVSRAFLAHNLKDPARALSTESITYFRHATMMLQMAATIMRYSRLLRQYSPQRRAKNVSTLVCVENGVSNRQFSRFRRHTLPPCMSRHHSSLAPRPESSVALLDLQSSSKIEGEESQIATVTLQPGQVLRAESGAMLFMTEGVHMEATSGAAISSAMKRMLTGQNLMVTDFTYTGDKEGIVGLGTDFPSKILRLRLEDYPNSTIIAQKGAYLASNPSVNIELAFAKNFSAGFFGGEGFVLQKLEGEGDVLIKAGGTLVKKELEEGQSLRVTSGSLVAFTDTVDYGMCRWVVD